MQSNAEQVQTNANHVDEDINMQSNQTTGAQWPDDKSDTAIDNATPVTQASMNTDSTMAEAQAPTPAQAEQGASKSTGLFEIVRRYASLSDLLRLSGAIAVAVAMGLFLLDGIEVVNDLQRFLTMLGLTGALTAAGLAMSMLLKEQRGSRVFISLALLSVPVNFTVFGALLYSIMPMDAMALNYPNYAHWQVGSVTDLGLGLIVGLAVLGPVIWLGYSVLARASRHWLSIALLASSAILVVPVRGELLSAGLAIGATVLLWLFCRRNASDSLVFKTLEGKLSVALLFVAPVIVAVRSLFFYDVDGVLILTLSVGFFVYSRQLMISLPKHWLLSTTLTLLTAAAIVGVCLASANMAVNFMPDTWMLFVVSIGLLILTSDLLRVSHTPVLSGVIGLLFAGAAIVGLVATTVFGSGMTLWVALTLIAIIGYGAWSKHYPLTGIGAIGLLALISLNAAELMFHAQVMWLTVLKTGWWGVAAGGALAIVAGSMIDRIGTVVKVRHQEAA
jgi:hypothetical protein